MWVWQFMHKCAWWSRSLSTDLWPSIFMLNLQVYTEGMSLVESPGSFLRTSLSKTSSHNIIPTCFISEFYILYGHSDKCFPWMPVYHSWERVCDGRDTLWIPSTEKMTNFPLKRQVTGDLISAWGLGFGLVFPPEPGEQAVKSTWACPEV